MSRTHIIRETTETENSISSLVETTDSLLQQNADFVSLVQVIRQLQEQQQKAKSDIEELKKTQNEALQNPMAFVEQLKHKERTFPKQQKIATVPEVNLDLYSMFVPSGPQDGGTWTKQEIEELQMLFIAFSSDKMATRWQKIADSLNKTPEQVEAQAQQLELVPRSSLSKKRTRDSSSDSLPNKKRKFNSPTTKQRLQIDQKDFDSESEDSLDSPFSDFSGQDSFLLSFEEVTIDGAFAESCNMPFTIHNGSKCKGCGMEPIRGPRWVCHDCCNTDLCETCYHSAWEDSSHKHTHRLSKADMPIHLGADQYLPIHFDFSEESSFTNSPLTTEDGSPLMSPLFDEEDEMHTSASLFDMAEVQLASSSFA